VFSFQDQWLKAKDVMVSAPSKSGTNWLLYTLHLIRSKRSASAILVDLYEEIGWCEFVYYPGQTLKERTEILQNRSRKYPIGMFKTHFNPLSFEIKDDVKYILLMRNPVDVVSSMRAFFEHNRKELSNNWGGFPASDAEDGFTNEEFADFLFHIGGNKRCYFDVMIMEYIKSWWPFRKHANVLFVHYSDRIKNDALQIERISRHIGLELTNTEIADIARLSSFDAMLQLEHALSPKRVFDSFIGRGLLPTNFSLFDTHNNNFTIMNKGPTRTGEKELPPGITHAIKQILYTELGAEIANWMMKGGEFPMHSEIPMIPSRQTG
jgi:hypothetical protein